MLAKQILNKAEFDAVVTDAIHAAIKNCKNNLLAQRWINAIGRAAEKVEEQGEFLHYDVIDNHLEILSTNSFKLYTANGVCQCRAYLNHQPCWHRACARLMRIYLGLAENVQPVFPKAEAVSIANTPLPKLSDFSDKPLLRNTSDRKPETLGGGIRF